MSNWPLKLCDVNWNWFVLTNPSQTLQYHHEIYSISSFKKTFSALFVFRACTELYIYIYIHTAILKGVKVNATDKIARHVVHIVSQFIFCFLYTLQTYWASWLRRTSELYSVKCLVQIMNEVMWFNLPKGTESACSQWVDYWKHQLQYLNRKCSFLVSSISHLFPPFSLSHSYFPQHCFQTFVYF